MIYIRADGNTEIGTGHIMRCLSITEMVLEMGGSCTFIVADREMVSLLATKEIPYICLGSVWNDLDRETDQMERLIREMNIRSLLVDSYFVTADYLSRLNRLTRVLYMDDLNAFEYPCSALVNYNIYADPQNYVYCSKVFMGSQYAPVRKEFRNLPKPRIREKMQDVLITVGGSDAYNVAGQMIKILKQHDQLDDVKFHVVAGRLNRNIEELEELAKQNAGIVIYKNVQQMSELMLACDAAISAGGSTLYELCACGTPTVCFAWADNQLEAIQAFEAQGIMLNAGDIRRQNGFFEGVIHHLDSLADCGIRQGLSNKMRSIVDGRGAERLAAYFMTF